MKGLCKEQQPSPDLSNYASTSGQSRDDCQEIIGSNPLSKSESDSSKKLGFLCFQQGMDFNPVRMFVAEMVGTFILMFCVSGIIASTQIVRGEVDLLEYATTAGLTVVVVIFSIGTISGAHVNPAVTIAFAALGQFPWSRVPFYVAAQTIGSVAASYIGKSVYRIKSEMMTTQPTQGCISAFWVELIATFIIMFLAASLTNEAQWVGHLSGFVVGIAIALAVLITGPVSGGSMNPARSLGPAIVSWKFKDIWVYVTAPVIGAVAGAFLHRVLRLQQPPCSSTLSPNTSLLNHSIGFGGS